MSGGWVSGWWVSGGWLDKLEIRLTSALVEVELRLSLAIGIFVRLDILYWILAILDFQEDCIHLIIEL